MRIRRIVERMWRIQEKFPVRTIETAEKGTEEGIRGNAHKWENAGSHGNMCLSIVLSPNLHVRLYRCSSSNTVSVLEDRLCCPPGNTQTCLAAHIL